MNQQSMKQRIYKVAYAVIGFALVVGITFGITQAITGMYVKRADDGAFAIRRINRTEMNFAHAVAAVRGARLSPKEKKYAKEASENMEASHKALLEAIESLSTPAINAVKLKVEKKQTEIVKLQNTIFAALEAGDAEAASKIYEAEYAPQLAIFEADLKEIRDLFRDEYEAAQKSLGTATLVNNLVMVLILLGSASGISIYSFRLARTISSSLEKISEELSSAAGSVRTVSGSVSTASQTLSETTTQQAAAIEQTVSSMEEMSSMLSQTSQNSQTTLQVSEEGQQEGERGKAVIAKMLSAMDEIHASNERLESIVRLIEQIQSKTKVINDIVFETRLLSFNASIEAARAGAHGKGFAVVAEEVGKLASMSGKAAEEIRTLLESSTAEVISVVQGTKDRVNAGRQVSQDCQVVFDVMSSSLEKIGGSVRMITAATKEQEQGVKQTNQAMGEMDQVTQKNSASAETLASQAGHLSKGAAQLLHSADTLKTVVFGGNAPAESVTAARKLEEVLPMAHVKEVKAFSGPKRIEVEPSKQSELDRSDSRWKVG